ncbi:MAG: hypothetical protein IJ630_03580 [Treponema sp.]|nr:hypothetical protein [Treponema sp.]
MFWNAISIVAVLLLASIAGSLVNLTKAVNKCVETMSALFALLIVYIGPKNEEG